MARYKVTIRNGALEELENYEVEADSIETVEELAISSSAGYADAYRNVEWKITGLPNLYPRQLKIGWVFSESD